MGTGLGVKGIAVDCEPTLAERKATLGSVPARQGTDAQKNPVGQAVPGIERQFPHPMPPAALMLP